MAGIKGQNTKPEIAVRKLLHKNGFRFRLHYSGLPGKPDIVLPRYKLCIFIHGCFWHRHEGCKYTTFPKTKVDFWEKKFSDTQARDRKNVNALIEKGWRTFEIWECGTKGSTPDLAWLPLAIRDMTIKILNWPQVKDFN
ncbi:very short patch repair endonuclease [Pseudomonas sp. W5-01]|uniref:very short patch repair endonuclease n=1 Tax=Pseudomonas sp. W5-01 TaxID=3097454 RepID=UPI0039799750